LLASIAIVFLVFAWRMNNAAEVSENQTDLLRELLVTLNTTTEFGVSLSRDLTGVTAELNSTSLEQASGAQQQVASVTEVTTSLEELNETASQIAANAEIAAMSANQGVTIANEVRENGELAQASVSEGEEAVEQTTTSVERVRNRIELLGQRLLYLTEQTRKVGSIIDIIDDIADETHLLALNASIEAAGSTGSNETAGPLNVRGERFGVIAQEVKNLSDRSRESTEEVREAITEMQGAVAAAVLVAEESKKDTAGALSRSQVAGMVIGKLSQVIAANAASAEQILRTVEEVNVRCEEIKIATGQQRSANQQILSTMRYISEVARDNANAVSGISGAVSRVNTRLDDLNMVLDKSSQSIQAAGI
jgi:methyl-accepting chemotaxis protein